MVLLRGLTSFSRTIFSEQTPMLLKQRQQQDEKVSIKGVVVHR